MGTKKQMRKGIAILMCGMLCVGMGDGMPAYAEATNEIEEQLLEEAVDIYVDGVKSQVVGRGEGNNCMVPVFSFLQKELGAVVSFDETDAVAITLCGKTIIMKNGELNATIEDQTVTLKEAPVVEGEEWYVPLFDVAEACGIVCVAEKSEDQGWIARITLPLVYSYEGRECYYYGDTISMVTFNGKDVSLEHAVPALILDDVMMVPLEETVENEVVKATVVASGEAIVAKRSGYSVTFMEECKSILANGKEEELKAAPRKIEYKGKTYFMVPACSLFEKLGADKVSIDTLQGKIIVTKKKGTYFSYIEDEIQESGNYVKKVKVSYKGTKDLVAVTCKKTPKISVKSDKKTVKLILKNVSTNAAFSEVIADSRYAKKISIKREGSKTILTVKKKSGISFITQYGSGKVYIYLNATPIKIAVDCGHGAKTPGKRTPKMPVNVDFEGDGVVDVKKGGTIKEHQANLGVGRVVASELERLGFKVCRSAFGSADVSLAGRQKTIRNFNAKYSVSVHFNAAGTGKSFNNAKGVEVFYHSKCKGESKKLAKAVLSEMVKGTPQINRGVKKQTLALCNTRRTGAKASILVECAFMTNKKEAVDMVGKEKYWEETGTEIAKGMCRYAGVDYLEK